MNRRTTLFPSLSVLLLSVAVFLTPIAAAAQPDARARLAKFVDAAAAEGFTGVVLVTRGAETLLLEARGSANAVQAVPMRPDSVATVGSITKQFTAAAVLKLHEQGRLKVSDPIGTWLPDVPPDKQAITLHHLLSHQAGFPGAIGDDRERVGRDEYVRRALATPLEFEPGSGYSYSNVGYSLAAAVVELVSGKSYEVFLRETFFAPAGMVDTGYSGVKWEPSRLAHGTTDDGGDWGTVVDRAIANGGPGWNLLGNGGIHSTAMDMARWHRALMGDDLLRADTRRLMYTQHADEGGGSWYGYGWVVGDTPWGRLVEHNGGNPYYFADYLRYLDRDVVIFYFTTSRDRRMHRLAPRLAEIVFTDAMPELEPPAAPMIERRQGPPAAEGSGAARWGFPGSIRGVRAGELLDAIVATDPVARRAFIDTSLEPGLVERNGVDKLLGMLDDLREEVGELQVQGARPMGENKLAIVIDTGRHAEPLQLILDLEPAEPHRINRIEVMVGD